MNRLTRQLSLWVQGPDALHEITDTTKNSLGLQRNGAILQSDWHTTITHAVYIQVYSYCNATPLPTRKRR